jgi:hypothetical protein
MIVTALLVLLLRRHHHPLRLLQDNLSHRNILPLAFVMVAAEFVRQLARISLI